MDKLSRLQVPDSSSSPPLNSMNFHYDDEILSDLPSCVYANQQQMNNGGNNQNNNQQQQQQTGNLRINSNNLRQIQQQYLHHQTTG